MLKLLVNGALGRMGGEVVRTVLKQDDMQLVGMVDVNGAGKQLEGQPVQTDLAHTLAITQPDVVVDFTRPDVVMNNLAVILGQGIKAVVGTTGFTPERLQEVAKLAQDNDTTVLIAPNFSLGAVVMVK